MKEINSIIKAYDASREQGQKSALVTVVHLEGSSYRRPGARMLVTDDGQMTGAISGGCLEGDALRKALLVLSQQQSRLVTYDTSDEDDATIGVQLGCAGIIQVLMEPILPGNPNNPIELLRKATSKRQGFVLVTGFSLEDKKNQQAGTFLLVEKDQQASGNVPDVLMHAVLLEDISTAFTQKRSVFRHHQLQGENITAFIEYVPPPVSLIIIGAGNDVMPVVAIADTLGWESTVVDGRPTHAKKERFASACQVLVSRPENVLEKVMIDDRTAFVLMTHNYNYDLAMLKALVNTTAPYIGVLGARKKIDRMFGEIKASGMVISKDQLNRIYGPVGLDLGSETPEDIALAIVAEIKAVMAGRKGESLRQRQEANSVNCGIVILAAGNSSRLGEPKQLLAYKGQTLLQNIAGTAIATGLSPVIVVLGAQVESVAKTLDGLPVQFVNNPEWEKGMSGSLKAGLAMAEELVPDLDALIFTVCDQPMVTTTLLLELLDTRRITGKPIIACSYKATKGTPALFDRSFFPALYELSGDSGARKLISTHADQVATINFPGGEIDIDTKNDYDAIIQPES